MAGDEGLRAHVAKLEAIVRDLAARHRRFCDVGMPDDPCPNCDGTWTSHAADCCGTRAVEAKP